ncbi:hypothetical protein [Robiginitalea sp. SC105]|uniref:hypothetical protein n=1 Tax=Robiginitalea sp. SC105 TaxID=2762332 RepID=UPI00163B360C|nr:hypothetical protein [Robiginitalea sp. SC105]MBC2840336.1 hypothetical protein [Robiginitalea sp. SC105]
MKYRIPTSPRMIVLCFFITLLIGCSKDSDLLYDYVVDNGSSSVDKKKNDDSVENETQNSETTSSEPVPDSNPESFKQSNGPLKAFPSAFGGGSIASGGRGKALAIITSLNKNEPLEYHPSSGANDEYYTGGFYEALRNDQVGYIVFNVSGNIDLGKGGVTSEFGFDGITEINNKTVFGQSAPRGGITLTGGTFRLNGRYGDNQNLIIRYLRSRPIYNRDGVLDTSDDAFTWAFLFYGGKNLIMDHCSASFAQDKAMGAFIRSQHVPAYPMTNFTFSNNLIADSGTGSYTEINPNQDGSPEKYVDLISWINNVSVSVNRTPNMAFDGRGEKINNIIHDTPSKQTSVYHDILVNEIGNYYSGSSSRNKVREDIDSNPRIYTSNNYFEGLYSGSEGNNAGIWTLRDEITMAPSSYFMSSPTNGFPNPAAPKSPQNAFQDLVILGDVGAYKYLDDFGKVQIYRDEFDSNQLSIVRNNQNYDQGNASKWILPEIPHNSRPADFDTDNDGMSDAWEIIHFGSLNESYRGDFDGDGYENIEEYMNQVDFE